MTFNISVHMLSTQHLCLEIFCNLHNGLLISATFFYFMYLRYSSLYQGLRFLIHKHCVSKLEHIMATGMLQYLTIIYHQTVTKCDMIIKYLSKLMHTTCKYISQLVTLAENGFIWPWATHLCDKYLWVTRNVKFMSIDAPYINSSTKWVNKYWTCEA